MGASNKILDIQVGGNVVEGNPITGISQSGTTVTFAFKDGTTQDINVGTDTSAINISTDADITTRDNTQVLGLAALWEALKAAIEKVDFVVTDSSFIDFNGVFDESVNGQLFRHYHSTVDFPTDGTKTDGVTPEDGMKFLLASNDNKAGVYRLKSIKGGNNSGNVVYNLFETPNTVGAATVWKKQWHAAQLVGVESGTKYGGSVWAGKNTSNINNNDADQSSEFRFVNLNPGAFDGPGTTGLVPDPGPQPFDPGIGIVPSREDEIKYLSPFGWRLVYRENSTIEPDKNSPLNVIVPNSNEPKYRIGWNGAFGKTALFYSDHPRGGSPNDFFIGFTSPTEGRFNNIVLDAVQSIVLNSPTLLLKSFRFVPDNAQEGQILGFDNKLDIVPINVDLLGKGTEGGVGLLVSAKGSDQSITGDAATDITGFSSPSENDSNVFSFDDATGVITLQAEERVVVIMKGTIDTTSDSPTGYLQALVAEDGTNYSAVASSKNLFALGDGTGGAVEGNIECMVAVKPPSGAKIKFQLKQDTTGKTVNIRTNDVQIVAMKVGGANTPTVASQSEAQTGTSNAVYMTPLRTAQAIAAQALTDRTPWTFEDISSATQTLAVSDFWKIKRYQVGSNGSITLPSPVGHIGKLIGVSKKVTNTLRINAPSGVKISNSGAGEYIENTTDQDYAFVMFLAVSDTQYAIFTSDGTWDVFDSAGQEQVQVSSFNYFVGYADSTQAAATNPILNEAWGIDFDLSNTIIVRVNGIALEKSKISRTDDRIVTLTNVDLNEGDHIELIS
ncbi:MAG: hypothetical protein F6K19_01705 [Cyanothece sp. SIO1E1]|nr:hypothetical protein [Cyanothece sp. SIO1E1]